MALPIEQLYKARDFLNLKNISANHVELSFPSYPYKKGSGSSFPP